LSFALSVLDLDDLKRVTLWMHGHHQKHFIAIQWSDDWVSCRYCAQVIGGLNEFTLVSTNALRFVDKPIGAIMTCLLAYVA
jgi:hypothetical protein